MNLGCLISLIKEFTNVILMLKEKYDCAAICNVTKACTLCDDSGSVHCDDRGSVHSLRLTDFGGTFRREVFACGAVELFAERHLVQDVAEAVNVYRLNRLKTDLRTVGHEIGHLRKKLKFVTSPKGCW